MAAGAKSDVCVVLLAGGVGKRFGLAVPKLLTMIKGRPVIAYTLHTAISLPFVSQVIIACNALLRSEIERILDTVMKSAKSTASIGIVDGGNSRSSSVGLALKHIKCNTVLIHDADRPIASESLYMRVYTAVKPGVGVVPVISPADSILREDARGNPANYIPRADLMLVQTPQGFITSEYRMAREILGAQVDRYTDDGSAFIAGGYQLRAVPGERSNIKITFPVDLAIAEAYINESGDA
jgi:2-C-methyl-D-erythritol 4-phosphate cytidylyltransferase